jgi:flagellar biogenesis protein FliO
MGIDNTTMGERATPSALSRREWALVVAGLFTWILLAWGGVWLVRQLTRSPGNCGTASDAPTRQVKGAPTGPRNAVQLLTRTGRCP